MTKDDYASLHLFLEEAEALLQKWERLMDVVTEIESIQLRLGEVGRIDRMMQLLDMFEAQNYMLKDFLTVDDAAMYLNLSKSTIYKMTSRGELPCYKPNSKTLFLLDGNYITISRNVPYSHPTCLLVQDVQQDDQRQSCQML